MKVHINYRALCPYTTNAQGEDVYHWYTEDIEADAVTMTAEMVLIHKGGKETSAYSPEQINILKITD